MSGLGCKTRKWHEVSWQSRPKTHHHFGALDIQKTEFSYLTEITVSQSIYIVLKNQKHCEKAHVIAIFDGHITASGQIFIDLYQFEDCPKIQNADA